jgi:hypothetical protein
MQSHTALRLTPVALISLLLIPSAAFAQHEGMHMPAATTLGISMDRMGSGTTWIPDAVSLPSRHFAAGQWNVMLHGFGFAQFISQSGPRGANQTGSLNWAMLMASRPLAGGTFQARTMLSLDPWSVTGRGYPLLLQTGETYGGALLYDRQHPHDFWMELGALYERPISKNLAISVYGGPSGEPALGPVAFMHRVSAMDDPIAPLGHHWQDATHISYGVATLGVFSRRWKLEASAFNGREPDERRFAMDSPKLDSYSARVTVNPSANWSATLGYGYLDSPEALDPTESVRRAVASLLHGRALAGGGQWSSTLVVGANQHHGEWSSSTLIETEAVSGANTLMARAELTTRTGENLDIPSLPPDEAMRVAAVSVGYIRDFSKAFGMTTGIGVRTSVNFVPAQLEPHYGSRTPTGLMAFIRVRPVRSVMPM